MTVTIYDIAKQANVSIATVSKVIHNTGRISSETRERVQTVMNDLGYRPSLLASAMTNKRTFTVGILIPDISNPFYPDVIRGAEDFAQQHNYSVLLCNTDNDPDKEIEYIELLKQKSVDGIIIAAVATAPIKLIESLPTDIPTTFLAREITGLDQDSQFPSVLVDNYLGGYMAAKHLLECGHHKISLLGESLNIDSSRERLRGCETALAEQNLKLHSVQFCSRELGIESGYRAMTELLRKNSAPTAVFAETDLLAIGAIQAAKQFGFRVPDDISIIGFDNTRLCTVIDPPLTSIAQPLYDLGQKSMEILLGQISGKPVPPRTILDITLVVRDSVKILGS